MIGKIKELLGGWPCIEDNMDKFGFSSDIEEKDYDNCPYKLSFQEVDVEFNYLDNMRGME